MQHRSSSALFLALFAALAPSATAQESDVLAKVRRTFAHADSNGDGLLDPTEAKAATIPSADFLAHDHDGDRRLSGDEFLVYYRGLLVGAGQDVPAQLSRRAERIEAARAQAARSELSAASAQSGGQRGARDVAADRVGRGQEALRDGVQAGDLTRTEAQRKRERMVRRAQAALANDAAPGAVSPNVADKLARVQSALDAKVASGAISKEDADRKMELLRRRAEEVSGRSRVVARRVVNEAQADGFRVDVEKRFDRAQDALRDRSASGDLSREDAREKQARLAERARNAAGDLSAADRQKLDAALKDLEAEFAAGRLSLDEYSTQRKALMQRAKRANVEGAEAEMQRARAEEARLRQQAEREERLLENNPEARRQAQQEKRRAEAEEQTAAAKKKAEEEAALREKEAQRQRDENQAKRDAEREEKRKAEEERKRKEKENERIRDAERRRKQGGGNQFP